MTSTKSSNDIINDIRSTFKQLREEKFDRPEKLNHLVSYYNNYENFLPILTKPENFYITVLQSQPVFNNIVKYISRFVIPDNVHSPDYQITPPKLFKQLLYVCWVQEMNDIMKSLNIETKPF